MFWLRYISRDSSWGGWSGAGLVRVRIYLRYTGRVLAEDIRIGIVREFYKWGEGATGQLISHTKVSISVIRLEIN